MRVLFLLLFLLVSQFYVEAKTPVLPEWVNDPMTACSTLREICAVGRGEGGMVAETNARKAIAEYFETKIESKTKVYKSSESTSDGGGLLSAVSDEAFNSEVTAITNQLLEGVHIKQRFEGEEALYALASLDKRKAASRLKSKMKAIDSQLAVWLADTNRSTYRRLVRKYYVRQKLNERYEFLHGGRYSEKITLSDISKKRKLDQDKQIKIFVQIKEGSQLKELQSLVVRSLTDSDYIVASSRSDSKYALLGSLKASQLALKVDGFVKHKFFVSLYTENAKGDRTGALSFDIVTTGISFAQTFERALPNIKDKLKKHLDELNLD